MGRYVLAVLADPDELVPKPERLRAGGGPLRAPAVAVQHGEQPVAVAPPLLPTVLPGIVLCVDNF